jgi:hypothetical protein
MEPKDIKSLPMPAVVLELGASRGLTGVYLGHLMAQKRNNQPSVGVRWWAAAAGETDVLEASIRVPKERPRKRFSRWERAGDSPE